MRNTCCVDGCNNPVVSIGKRKDSQGKITTLYCDKHYARIKAHGTAEDNSRTHGAVDERFWRYVKKTDSCWLWIGNRTKSGYGMLKASGRNGTSLMAHRISYEIHYGEIPDGLLVMHKCDNPQCVNPLHLQLGTYSDNAKDSVYKGRNAINVTTRCGEMNGRAILTADEVRKIRASDASIAELARQYGMSESGMSKIVKGLTWKHVK